MMEHLNFSMSKTADSPSSEYDQAWDMSAVSFSKSPPFLRALTFSEDDYAQAARDQGVLELRVHVTRKCDLRCIYCFTHDLNVETQVDAQGDDREKLSFEEICRVVEEAKDLGVRTIHVLGPGEPLLYERLEDLIKFTNRIGLVTYFPSNLLTMSEPFARFLYENNVDLMGKFNSLDPAIQDQLVGKKGAHAVFEEKLNMLANIGFTEENRLAAHCIISKLNYSQIPEVFTYLRERGIVPFVDTLTMTGKAGTGLDVEASAKEDLFEHLSKIDRELFGYRWKRSDFPHIGDDFRRYLHVCVVNLYGDVYPTDCLRVKLGLNVRDLSLAEMTTSPAYLESRTEEKHVKAMQESLPAPVSMPYQGAYTAGGIVTADAFRAQEGFHG